MKREKELVVIYFPSSEITALMIRGYLERKGLKVILRSYQIPWYDNLGTIIEGAWGEILVFQKDEKKARKLINDYLEKIKKNELF